MIMRYITHIYNIKRMDPNGKGCGSELGVAERGESISKTYNEREK